MQVRVATGASGWHSHCHGCSKPLGETAEMSTLWEMAAALRSEAAATAPREIRRQAALIDLAAPGRVAYWCRLLGTTPMRLCCAVEEVGDDPTAVRRFLARHPGAGTHRLAPGGAV